MPDHHAEEAELRLVFEGLTADDHEVPAAVLVQAIAGMQRAIYLLAMEHERVDVRLRERTPRRLEERYALLVSPPHEGSLQIAARVGALAPQTDALASPQAVAALFKQVARAVEAGDERAINEAVRDRARRSRLLESFRSMLPKAGSGLTLRIENGDGSALLHTPSGHRNLQSFMSRVAPEEQTQRTVTGRLAKIHFDERRLTLFYAPTNRELECIYDEGTERTLLEHPRDLIQVTGTVVLDEAEQPKKIIDVEEIQELDMSPFYLTRFEYADRTLEFKDIRVIEPQLDSDEQMLIATDEELGIDVAASTRDELFTTLAEEFDVLWRNYALASDDELTPAAVVLKNRLLEAMVETGGAAR